jgi:hypothetical protein
MVESIGGCVALRGIFNQKVHYQIFSLIWNIYESLMLEMIFSSEYIFYDLFIRVTGEWYLPGQQNIKDDTHAPQVTFGIIVLVEHFRCNIVWLYKLAKSIYRLLSH